MLRFPSSPIFIIDKLISERLTGRQLNFVELLKRPLRNIFEFTGNVKEVIIVDALGVCIRQEIGRIFFSD